MDFGIPIFTSALNWNETPCNLEIFDREPYGLIIRCKVGDKELFLPIAEHNLSKSGFSRSKDSLDDLLHTLSISSIKNNLTIESSNNYICQKRRIETPDDVDSMMNSKIGESDTMRTVLLKGLVEVCKVKPRGEEAIEWLGNWLIQNNPNQPRVLESE